MRHHLRLTVGSLLALSLLLFTDSFACHDEQDMRNMVHKPIKVRVEIDGKPHYDSNRGWKIATTWSCVADPWLTRNYLNPVFCQRTGATPEGNPPPLLSNEHFNASQIGGDMISAPYKKALPPAPALPPRQVSAAIWQQLARSTWALPADHTRLHPTVAWFRVERRPVMKSPIAWFAASSNLPATRTVYDDPDSAKTKT